MADFKGIVFTPLQEVQWDRKAHITRRPIPYGNKENVQFGGYGNWRVTVPVRVAGWQDLERLQTAQGTVGHLNDFQGQNFAGVMLERASNPRRNPETDEGFCELTFNRTAG